MLHSANRISQGLKLIVKERKEACEVGMEQIATANLDMIDRIGKLRLKVNWHRARHLIKVPKAPPYALT